MEYKVKGEIYIIENDVNTMVYIGKTYRGYESRFKQHITDSLSKDNKRYNTKIHRAMRNLGVKHFRVRKICDATSGELEELERRYIKEYNSFYNGYNSTLGGDTGRRIEVDDSTAQYCLYLFTNEGISISKIVEMLDISYYTVKSILMTEGIDTNKSFKNLKLKLKSRVYGVQRKCGHIVSFDNEYIASEELINARLTKQSAYYVKNDIKRSIKEEKYGVGGYIWFRTYTEAINFRNKIDNKENYRILKINGSQLVRAEIIETKREKQTRLYSKSKVNKININYIDPECSRYNDKDTLAELIKYFTVYQIASKYQLSFSSIKKRLCKFGLPSTKEEIKNYRQDLKIYT